MHERGAGKGQDQSLHIMFADFLSWCCSLADGPVGLCSASSLLASPWCIAFPSLLSIRRLLGAGAALCPASDV